MICLCPKCGNVFESIPVNNEHMEMRLRKALDIRELCKEYYGVSETDLKGRNKKKKVSACRHMAIYLVLKYCGYKKTQVGRLFNRDHTSVIHAEKRVKNSLFTQQDLFNDLKLLQDRVEMSVFNPLKVAS